MAWAFAALERYHREDDVIGSLRPRLWPFPQPRPLMLVHAMITDPAAIRIRALIPDPTAIRTFRAMSMPRLESQPAPATGSSSASGTGMLARAPRAHLRLIRSRLYRCLDRLVSLLTRVTVALTVASSCEGVPLH